MASASTATLAELISAAASGGTRTFYPSYELLQTLRKDKIRRPDLVIKYGRILLDHHKHRLGDEVWIYYEQVLIAALDVGERQIAASYLQILDTKFPGSTRVARLAGMLLEFDGKYAEAEKHYSTYLATNPANSLMKKRQVAVTLAQGKTNEAIKMLNLAIQQTPMDASLWQQLGSLHLTLGNYRLAAFCFEELVVRNPIDPFWHCQLAEIYCSIGGVDNLRNARKHYSESLNHQPKKNVRALVGLLMCCKYLTAPSSNKNKNSESDEELNEKLLKYAQNGLLGEYEASAPDQIDIVKGALFVNNDA